MYLIALHFCLLQQLPVIPKLFTQSVACPNCGYANDLNFRFCQDCGYARKISISQPKENPGDAIDPSALDERLAQLANSSASSAYAKQKSALQAELEYFLKATTPSKNIHAATPRDLCRFLTWKDRKGKTIVHTQHCVSPPRVDSKTQCSCPTRLAFGTVDSLIGKLRAIFNNLGRRGEWDPRFNQGNPATDHTLKQYLKAITEEQIQARALPRKPTPLFENDLRLLCRTISQKLQNKQLSSIEMFTFTRDQAFFTTLFFSGNRAGDLGQVKADDILRFPDNNGLIFNQVWGKTLRNGASNVFGLRRHEDPEICPIFSIDTYVNFSRILGIDLRKGFLFRPTSPRGTVLNKPLTSSAADSRLAQLAKETELKNDVTVHGFRSGCAITLALSGSELKDIMSHIGWRTQETTKQYLQLSKVLGSGSPAALLSKRSTDSESATKDYRELDELQGFTPAFR